jgi:hypothetical protein
MRKNVHVESGRTDLEAAFGALADSLPRHILDGDSESFVFTRHNLPQPRDMMLGDQFWLRRVGLRFYDNFPNDGLDLCIDKRSSTLLGLLLLASVFHPEPATIDVELTHPASKIRHLRLRYEQPREQPGVGGYAHGYTTTPDFFAYRAGPVERGPWANSQPADPSDLPRLQITSEDEMGPMSWSEFDDRNTLLIESSDRAIVRLAQLLLDAGLEDNSQDEFQLGPDWCGMRGVAPMSAVLSIFLPGSIGYDPEDSP